MAEYLLAAQQALDQPTTEDFMLIADGNDLNPAMLVRWQAYLSRTRKGHDPVFSPWHALAALPEAEFTSRVEPLIARFVAETDPSRTINPVRRPDPGRPAARDRWPRRRGSTRGCSGSVEQLWQDAARRAKLDGRTPEPLPVAGLGIVPPGIPRPG